MRTTYRWDKQMDCLVEVGGNSNYFEEENPRSANVISDDVGAGVRGLRHMPSGKMLDSKSRFREADKRAGRECVGNETNFASQKTVPNKNEYRQMVVDADAQLTGNWNGTRDRVRQLNERR